MKLALGMVLVSCVLLSIFACRFLPLVRDASVLRLQHDEVDDGCHPNELRDAILRGTAATSDSS